MQRKLFLPDRWTDLFQIYSRSSFCEMIMSSLVESAELVLSDQDVPMGRLGNQQESHSSQKLTRESSTEAPPERRRRRKKKSATIGKSLSVMCLSRWESRRRNVWTAVSRSGQRPSRSGQRRHSQSEHRWRGSAEKKKEKVRKAGDQFTDGPSGTCNDPSTVPPLNLQKVKGEGVPAG